MAPTDPQRQRWQARIFAVTWMGYAAFYLCRKNFSVLMPMWKSEVGLSTDHLAQAVFLYSVGYAIGQLMMGLAADRWGARRVAALGMVMSAALTATMSLPLGAPVFLTLQFGNGLFQAAGWPSLVKLITHWFGAGNRGTVMAWWCSNYVAGAFLATVFATFAATGPVLAALGWKRGLWAPALVLGAFAVVFWMSVRDQPSSGQVSLANRRASVWSVARNPGIRTIAAAYFFIKMTRYALLFWLPLYMVERLGYSVAEAGYTSSVYELVGFLGVLASGYLSDRAFRGRRFPVGALFLLGLAGACLIFPALSQWSREGNWIGIGLLGILTFGPDTLMGGAATQDAADPETAATAAGLVNGVGSMGQLLSPLVVSTVVRLAGWDSLFYLFVLCALTGAAVLATRWTARPMWQASPQEA